MKIKFVNIPDVYNFVKKATEHNGEVHLRSGNYNVDGKSILGVFSLDLLHELELNVENGDYSAFEEFRV